MDLGFGSCITPLFIFYSCGPCMIFGIIGVCCNAYCYWKSETESEKESWKKCMKWWAVGIFPLVGPYLALKYIN